MSAVELLGRAVPVEDHDRRIGTLEAGPVQSSSCERRLTGLDEVYPAAVDLSGDLLVLAGDNVLDFSLTHFIRYARARGTSCTMRYWEEDEARLKKSGISEIGEDDVLLSLEEKPAQPKSHWCTPPFYFYKQADIARVGEAIADGFGVDAPGSFVAWLAEKAPVHAMEMPGSRYDIGNLESYENVQKIYKGVTK